MDLLPPELHAKIAGFLYPSDLRSLRLVSKRHADVAVRPLFELLRFSGEPQEDDRDTDSYRPVRTRTVEFVTIPKVVDEILDYSIAQYTKTFVFDPAYYRRGFWQDYRTYLENQMYEPIAEEFDTIEEARSILDQRRSRPEKEAPIIDALEILWEEKVAQQEENEGIIIDALAELFCDMNMLEELHVKPWEFTRFAGLRFDSFLIDAPRRDFFPSTYFLGILAQALHVAGRSIKRLNVSQFSPDRLHSTPATRHIFTGLEEICLDMLHVECLLEGAGKSLAVVELFERAQPTLKKLTIIGGGRWPHIPARGAHSLLKMLSDGPDESPFIFPNLEYVYLEGLLLSTPPLLRFLRAQPSLKHLHFRFIYLSTNNAGWPVLIEGFPASVMSWQGDGQLAHEPLDMGQPTSHNWMTTWIPRKFPPSGWKVNEEGLFQRVTI